MCFFIITDSISFEVRAVKAVLYYSSVQDEWMNRFSFTLISPHYKSVSVNGRGKQFTENLPYSLHIVHIVHWGYICQFQEQSPHGILQGKITKAITMQLYQSRNAKESSYLKNIWWFKTDSRENFMWIAVSEVRLMRKKISDNDAKVAPTWSRLKGVFSNLKRNPQYYNTVALLFFLFFNWYIVQNVCITNTKHIYITLEKWWNWCDIPLSPIQTQSTTPEKAISKECHKIHEYKNKYGLKRKVQNKKK